jgi:hypothetical protein
MENQYDPSTDPEYRTKIDRLGMFTGRSKAECATAIKFFYGNVDRACDMILDKLYDPATGDLVSDRPGGPAAIGNQ